MDKKMSPASYTLVHDRVWGWVSHQFRPPVHKEYVEDGTPKIHFIHLKDILEESINYNLSADKSDFIPKGRVSQIKSY